MKKFKRGIFIVFMAIFAFFQLFPLIWLFDFSLCKSGDLFASGILKWPDPPQWQNYITAWRDGKVFHYLCNSLLVNFLTIVIVLLIAITMGYALTRMQWKLKNFVLGLIMAGLMIPIHATLLPNFIIFNKLKLIDSFFGLLIPYVAFAIPLSVYIMTGFIQSVPASVEEAAVIDGCGIFGIIFRVVLPMCKPAIMTICIMTFLNTWNEFIMAVTYLSSEAFKTLPFAVMNFAGQYASNYAVQFAVMALTALPAIIIYVLLSDQITKGVALGAVKG